MAIRKPHIYQKGYYFITFTNTKWLPLIQQTEAYDLVYAWFDYLKQNKHLIISYVIMPNHIHLMLAYNGGKISLNTLVGNGKRFITYEIVKRLKDQNDLGTLIQLQSVLQNSDLKKQKKHTVFKTSFDVMHCYSRKIIQQKIDYIHKNPCNKKWMLASDIAEYEHSSARYYHLGEHSNYSVKTWIELETLDWWEE